MTFKGMLKIVINDYKKQHDAKMFSIANELLRTRRELSEVKEQLRILQLSCIPPPSKRLTIPVLTISLFVQYNGFLNELCDIRQTTTIKELLVRLRQMTGISIEQPIRIRVLSDDGLTTLFFLDKELDRTLESYDDELKAGMILRIEDDDDDEDHILDRNVHHIQRPKRLTSSERTHSYESDV